MMKQLWGIALALLVACHAAAESHGAEKALLESDLAADHYAAGCPVRSDRPVKGDVFLAGCSVDVQAAVDGDALLAGGDLRIGAPIGQSLYAAGGDLKVDSSVGRNARVAGGKIEIGRQAQIGGNLTAGGGDIRINGAVQGYVRVGGGKVLINGPVAGDVVASSGELELGPDARIDGQLHYASGKELRRDPAARVRGAVERTPFERGWSYERAGRRMHRAGWIWSLGLMVIAAVLAVAWPELFGRVGATLRTRFGVSLLAGFVAFVCIPVAALILLLTIIGVPLALNMVLLYFVLLVVGYASTGIGLGDWALSRFGPGAAPGRGRRIAAAALGMLAISLLGRVPFLGALIVLVALLAGLGALVLQLAPPGLRTAR
jgi:cytoskeletal protein CcmA (bactofilin family)